MLHSLGSRKITVQNGRATKSGSSLREHEAENQQYIAENTTIPVPQVYEVERDEDGKVQSFVMDYVQGQPLDEAWSSLTEEQKTSIAQQLHGYMLQLRQLKGDYIGAVNRGKVVIGEYVFHEGGPFDTERSFNEFLFSRIIDIVPDVLRYHATSTFKSDHEIVFTHGDLAPRNILVDERGRVTAILDWENAGWYPEYWEHVRAFRDMTAVPGWPTYLSQILPPRYSHEFVSMAYLARLSH